MLSNLLVSRRGGDFLTTMQIFNNKVRKKKKWGEHYRTTDPIRKSRITKRKKLVYNLRKVNNSPGLYSIEFLKHVVMNNYNVTDILLRKIQNSTQPRKGSREWSQPLISQFNMAATWISWDLFANQRSRPCEQNHRPAHETSMGQQVTLTLSCQWAWTQQPVLTMGMLNSCPWLGAVTSTWPLWGCPCVNQTRISAVAI